jgi:hypothetical protein
MRLGDGGEEAAIRPGDGGEEAVAVALDGSGTRAQRGEKERGVVRWRVAGALPFIGAGESNEVVRRGGGRHVKAAVMTVVKI